MLKLGRRARGHFVTLIEICVHLIRALGSFLESPETLRAIFGCHNSLCNSRTESI